MSGKAERERRRAICKHVNGIFLPSPLKVILKVKVNMILSVTFGRRFIGAAQSVASPRVPAWTTWLPAWTRVSWPSPASASHKCQLGRIIKCQKRKFPSICRASPLPPPPSGCLHYNVVLRAVILSFSSPGLVLPPCQVQFTPTNNLRQIFPGTAKQRVSHTT